MNLNNKNNNIIQTSEVFTLLTTNIKCYKFVDKKPIVSEILKMGRQPSTWGKMINFQIAWNWKKIFLVMS